MLVVIVSAATVSHASQRGLTRVEAVQIYEADRNHALVIGIDKYENLQPLNYAVADAGAVSKTFKAHGYIVHQLIDFEATPGHVFKKLKEIAADIGRSGEKNNGSVVLYFAGHGFTHDNRNYLATGDTLPESISSTSIDLKELTDYVESLGISQRSFFVDACRNDASRSLAASSQSFVRDSYAQGLAVLQSTQPGGFSFEDAKLGHGVFTHYLVQGLGGEAADKDGWITFDGLRNYLTKKVRQHVEDRFGHVQAPYASTDYTGTFVLAKYSQSVERQVQNLQRAEVATGPSPGIKFTHKVESVMDAIFKYGEAHAAFGNSGGLQPGNTMQFVQLTDQHLGRIQSSLADLKASRSDIDFSGPELAKMIDILENKAALFQEYKVILLSIDNTDQQLSAAHQGIKQAINNDQWKLKDTWERDRIKLAAHRNQLFKKLIENQDTNTDLNEPSMIAIRAFVNALADRYPDMHEAFGN